MQSRPLTGAEQRRAEEARALNASLRELGVRYGELARNRLGSALVSAVLFGSVARGEANPYSDIDLLLVIEDLPHGRFARMARLDPVAQELEGAREALWRRGVYTDFSVIVLTPDEARRTRPLYLDLVEDAILLWDRDGFFAGILERLRNRLGELGSRRLHRGRTRYWLLTPTIRPGGEDRVVSGEEIARSHIGQAGEVLSEGLRLEGRGLWHLVVRRAQEAVELALKGALRLAGVEVPHVRDVGMFLKEAHARFPETFAREIDRYASISRRLRAERELSFYGDEETQTTAEGLYSSEDAKAALADAEEVLRGCRELLEGWRRPA
ncbi:MAG: HEPN domain-containing protein [Candidatus Methylacidiphilaceae bacterium]